MLGLSLSNALQLFAATTLSCQVVDFRDLTWHPLLDPFRVMMDIEECAPEDKKSIADVADVVDVADAADSASISVNYSKPRAEFQNATPVSELANNGLSVNVDVRPVSVFIDKSLVHAVNNIAKQFSSALESPQPNEIYPPLLTSGPTPSKKNGRSSIDPSEAKPSEQLSPNGACWEFINNTQYKVHMGRVGSTEDYLLLPCSSLFHHWNVWLKKNQDSPEPESHLENLEIWTDHVGRSNSTKFQFDKTTDTSALLPLSVADPSPSPTTKLVVSVKVEQQGMRTKVSIEGSHKFVNLLNIPLTLELSALNSTGEREIYGKVVSHPRSLQHFAVPQLETMDKDSDSTIEGPLTEVQPTEIRVTFFGTKELEAITQTLPIQLASPTASTQLIVHPKHVIGMTVEQTSNGTTSTVISFKNILRVQNLTPFPISCRPSFLKFANGESDLVETQEVTIHTNSGKSVHVEGRHEGIHFCVPQTTGMTNAPPKWSKEFVPVPFDLNTITPDSEKLNVISTGNFNLHVKTIFDAGLRQVVMVVYLPYYFVNLTTKPLLFKPELKDKSTKDARTPVFVDSELDPYVVLPGAYQPFPEAWEDWIDAEDEKYLALGVPSDKADVGHVSWSYPFTVSKSVQTLASIKTRAHIYSRFSLVVQKTNYITSVTIRPRVILINRTKRLLHVDNTHNLGAAPLAPSSGNQSPSGSLVSTPRSSVSSVAQVKNSAALHSDYGVLLEPKAQFSLNEWKIKSISELSCVIRLCIVDNPSQAQVRHQWSSELDLSQPTELNHIGVPKSGQLTPIILKYSIVEHEGILYVILLPTPNPPLTIHNETDAPFVYTLGTTNKASLIPAQSSVECYWESESSNQQSVFSTSSLKERNVLNMKSPNRLIRFGKLGGLEWSDWFNTREIGPHELRIIENRIRARKPGDPLPPNPRETDTVLNISCCSSGGCSTLTISSVKELPAVLLHTPTSTPLQQQVRSEAIVAEKHSELVASLKNFSLTINISQINISVVDDKLKECIHLSIDEISVFFGMFFNKDNPYILARERFHFESAIQAIQIDSHLPEVEFPVVLCRAASSGPNLEEANQSPFLKIVAIFATNSERTLIRVDHVDIGIVPFSVNVDDPLITKATELADSYAAVLTNEQPSLVTSISTQPSAIDSLGVVVPPTIAFPENLINILEGSEFYINYMFLGAIHIEFTLHAGVGVYVGLGSTPIDLSPVVVQDIECLPHHVGSALVQRYVLDLLSSSPAMLGSLDVLGNPTMLWQDVVAGFSDFFSIPVKYVKKTFTLGINVFLAMA